MVAEPFNHIIKVTMFAFQMMQLERDLILIVVFGVVHRPPFQTGCRPKLLGQLAHVRDLFFGMCRAACLGDGRVKVGLFAQPQHGWVLGADIGNIPM
jgi:hypothetical protein